LSDPVILLKVNRDRENENQAGFTAEEDAHAKMHNLASRYAVLHKA